MVQLSDQTIVPGKMKSHFEKESVKTPCDAFPSHEIPHSTFNIIPMSQGVLTDTYNILYLQNRKQLSCQTKAYGYRPLAKEAFQASICSLNRQHVSMVANCFTKINIRPLQNAYTLAKCCKKTAIWLKYNRKIDWRSANAKSGWFIRISRLSVTWRGQGLTW